MNLAHIIDAHPDSSAALVSRGRSTTYGTLREQIASMRGALLRENVGKGDVVALLCGNSRYFVVSYFAAIGIGAIIAPLNPTSPAPEIEGELLVIKPTVVVVEPAAAAAWELIPLVTSSAVRVVIGTGGHSIPGLSLLMTCCLVRLRTSSKLSLRILPHICSPAVRPDHQKQQC